MTHPLRAAGADASEDGTGRGTPIITVPSVTSHYGKGPDSDATDAMVFALQERGREGGRNLEIQEGIAYSLNAPKGGGRRQENTVAYQCHGSNVGPMGTGRAGNGNVTGGVPFIVDAAESCAKKDHAREADVARCLDGTGEVSGQQKGGCGVMSVRRLTPL